MLFSLLLLLKWHPVQILVKSSTDKMLKRRKKKGSFNSNDCRTKRKESFFCKGLSCWTCPLQLSGFRVWKRHVVPLGDQEQPVLACWSAEVRLRSTRLNLLGNLWGERFRHTSERVHTRKFCSRVHCASFPSAGKDAARQGEARVWKTPGFNLMF